MFPSPSRKVTRAGAPSAGEDTKEKESVLRRKWKRPVADSGEEEEEEEDLDPPTGVNRLA